MKRDEIYVHSSSYLQDDHEVSALRYVRVLCVTIIPTLEDMAAYL